MKSTTYVPEVSNLSGLFKRLREPGYFARVDVQFGAICWPDGQDIAPETLLAGMQLQSFSRAA